VLTEIARGWFCQYCGYEHRGGFPATAPLPTCPRCGGLHWSTEPPASTWKSGQLSFFPRGAP
jgi:hypothetical protein